MSAPAIDIRNGTVVSDLAAAGVHQLASPVDPAAAADLLARIRRTRRFDESLFLSESEFDADPQFRGVNPRPGRNLLEALSDRLGFVEQDPQVRAALASLLGDGYAIQDRKVVCGVPQHAVPAWIRRRIEGNPVNNLGPFVRPEHRDVTYFYGIDFHQDLIDYRAREADFVTLYVYLHPVTPQDAPLYVLEGSHRLGAAIFPHDLTALGDGRWLYRNGDYGEVETRQVVLTGGAGYTALWHACTLHGTQPGVGDEARLSLRYIFARGPGPRAALDGINAGLAGPLSLSSTRTDLGADGDAVVKHNAVRGA